MPKFFVLAIVALMGCASQLFADVNVTNGVNGSETIHVQVETAKVGNPSPKTEIKAGKTVVFKRNSDNDVKVTVYVRGFEKASATVKNNAKVIVENKNGVWTIKTE